MITRETFTAITTKIAQSFNPEKIIFFCSYIWGKTDRESDFIAAKTLAPKEGLDC